MTTTYVGDFHREGDVWVAEVRQVPQAHTYGRTLVKAKENLRDALALFLDVALEEVDIVVNLDPEDRTAALLRAAQDARRKAEDAAETARQTTFVAISALIEAGHTYRDAGAALGMSHQRVEQLASATGIGVVRSGSYARSTKVSDRKVTSQARSGKVTSTKNSKSKRKQDA